MGGEVRGGEMRGELRGELRGEMRAEERDGEGHHHRDPLHVLDEPHREVAVGAPDLAGGVGHEAGHVGRDVVLVVELAAQHEHVTVGQVADRRLLRARHVAWRQHARGRVRGWWCWMGVETLCARIVVLDGGGNAGVAWRGVAWRGVPSSRTRQCT